MNQHVLNMAHQVGKISRMQVLVSFIEIGFLLFFFFLFVISSWKQNMACILKSFRDKIKELHKSQSEWFPQRDLKTIYLVMNLWHIFMDCLIIGLIEYLSLAYLKYKPHTTTDVLRYRVYNTHARPRFHLFPIDVLAPRNYYDSAVIFLHQT